MPDNMTLEAVAMANIHGNSGTPPASSVSPTDSVEDRGPVTTAAIVNHFKTEIAGAEKTLKDRAGVWKRNVDLRIGRYVHDSTRTAGLLDDAELRTEINPDWALTKTKTANLYSQTPQVVLTHENKKYVPAIGPFGKQLNYRLSDKGVKAGVAIEEELNDVVNAAGVGGVLVGYEARYEDALVPALPPEAVPQGTDVRQLQRREITTDQAAQLPVSVKQQMVSMGVLPVVKAPRPVSYKFYWTRISPSQLLLPQGYKNSDYNDAPWVGYKDDCSWADGRNWFGLSDADKTLILNAAKRNQVETSLQHDTVRLAPESDMARITYKRLYYWRARIDPDEKQLDAIWEIVFVDGKDDPVIHRAWTGQKYDTETRKYTGSCLFPLQILTLTYITDNPLPPSDSEAGRPHVNDMRKSRQQMFRNRERSVPIRWFDVNRVDTTVQDSLMRGEWQAMIPTNGDGSKSIGEIARASYPAEDLSFDRQSYADLMLSWQMGPNQLGQMSTGENTKAEVMLAQANFGTRLGQERGRVVQHFLNCVQVLAGLMVLYDDFPLLDDEEKQAMFGAWDQKTVLHNLVFRVRPDSTVLIDTNTRLQRLEKAIDITGKSGLVNPLPMIMEFLELSGIDPATVLMQPKPQSPDMNVSLRLTGKDDLMSPFVVGTMIHAGHAPSMEEVGQAIQLLNQTREAELQSQQASTTMAPSQPGQPTPPPGPQPMRNANPDWTTPDTITQRAEGSNA